MSEGEPHHHTLDTTPHHPDTTSQPDTTHHLDTLNKHLTRKQISLPKVVSCESSDTPTCILYTLTLRVPDLAIVCESHLLVSCLQFNRPLLLPPPQLIALLLLHYLFHRELFLFY